MKVVISGSFRKHLPDIIELKKQLEMDGIEVLKPNNIDVIENQENSEFIKFSGEEEKSEYDLEQEYLDAIFESDAHIIFNKDGYIGSSALAELCLGSGNHAFTKQLQNKSLTQTLNSSVYLLEPLNPKKLDKNTAYIIQYLILKQDIKIGINQMYQDFNIYLNQTRKR